MPDINIDKNQTIFIFKYFKSKRIKLQSRLILREDQELINYFAKIQFQFLLSSLRSQDLILQQLHNLVLKI